MTKEVRGRSAEISRTTGETDIKVSLDIDGSGDVSIATGVPFMDHMLTLFGVHGFFNLTISAKGDIEVDDHHTVEDVGICLGRALASALGDKGGIRRYGMSYVPMDETLVRTVVDISNRPVLHYLVPVPDQKVGTFDTNLAQEFMRAFSQHGGLSLHIDLIHGQNSHHIIEAVFKALGRAINDATTQISDTTVILSSKGCL